MAFTPETLQPLGGAARTGKSTAWWTYATQDSAASVNGAGYFGNMRYGLRVGDVIVRTQLDGAGALVETGLHEVITRTASSVTTRTAELAVGTSSGMPITGGSFTGFVAVTSDDAVTAAGADLAGATLLAAQSNRIGTCAASQGVRLNDAVPVGGWQDVLDDTANDARVYPVSGHAINSLSTDAPFVLPAGQSVRFRRMGVAQWRTF